MSEGDDIELTIGALCLLPLSADPLLRKLLYRCRLSPFEPG